MNGCIEGEARRAALRGRGQRRSRRSPSRSTSGSPDPATAHGPGSRPSGAWLCGGGGAKRTSSPADRPCASRWSLRRPFPPPRPEGAVRRGAAPRVADRRAGAPAHCAAVRVRHAALAPVPSRRRRLPRPVRGRSGGRDRTRRAAPHRQRLMHGGRAADEAPLASARVLPTPEQIDAYRRDGFLVVDEWLERGRGRARARALPPLLRARVGDRARAGRGQLRPPATPRPTARASSATSGRPTARSRRTVLAERIAAFGAALAGAPGMRLIQDNMIWKPPSGKALLATRTPPTSTSSSRRT